MQYGWQVMKVEDFSSVDEPISVLMPVFNREDFIGKAIKSIVDQTHEKFEFIMYDDGSTDSTRSIMDEASFQDDRIRVLFSDENKGVAHARNQLLDACKYSYACWQDSDDMSHPHRLSKQIIEMCPFSMIFTKWRWFTDDEHGLLKRDAKYSVDKATPTLMFPVDKSIRFDEDKRFGGEDWDWINKMKASYSHESEIDEVLYLLRFHNDRIGVVKRRMNENERHLSYRQVVERLNEA